MKKVANIIALAALFALAVYGVAYLMQPPRAHAQSIAIGSGSGGSNGSVTPASITGTLGSLNATLTASMDGQVGAGIVLPASTTLVGVLTPYFSCDGGTTFTTSTFIDGNGNATNTQTVASGTALQIGISTLPCARQVRVQVTTYTSGTVSATLATTQQAATGSSIQGFAASGAAPSGAPLQDGVVAHTTLPTAVADNQMIPVMGDKFGRVVTVANADRALVSQSGVITLTSTTETTLLAAVASTFLDITYFHCENTSATLVRVDLRDSTGGTIRDTFVLAASGGSGGAVPRMPLNQATVNNNWTVQLSGAVTDVRCVAQAVQNK